MRGQGAGQSEEEGEHRPGVGQEVASTAVYALSACPAPTRPHFAPGVVNAVNKPGRASSW